MKRQQSMQPEFAAVPTTVDFDAKNISVTELREIVARLAAFGNDAAEIALILGMDEAIIAKRFSKEIESGPKIVSAQIAEVVYQRALRGDMGACVFYLRARGGSKWRDSTPKDDDDDGTKAKLIAAISSIHRLPDGTRK